MNLLVTLPSLLVQPVTGKISRLLFSLTPNYGASLLCTSYTPPQGFPPSLLRPFFSLLLDTRRENGCRYIFSFYTFHILCVREDTPNDLSIGVSFQQSYNTLPFPLSPSPPPKFSFSLRTSIFPVQVFSLPPRAFSTHSFLSYKGRDRFMFFPLLVTSSAEPE